jgi:transcriptional regulator with XRE-family HTH domain
MDVRRKLAGNMKRLRRANGWSQERLADEAGLDRTYISGIERMVRNPTITSVQKVIDALDSSFAELLDRTP